MACARAAAGLAVRPTPLTPGADAAGIVVLLVLLLVACAVWVVDPYAALLVVPGLHVLLPSPRPSAVRARWLVWDWWCSRWCRSGC